MRIRFHPISILINVVLAVVLAVFVASIVTCENELNNFELFIESMNNNPIRVYAVILPTMAEPVFIQNELSTEEKEEFIQFLSSSEEKSFPSRGQIYDRYDFRVRDKVDESKVKIWGIEAMINKETGI